MGGEGVVVVIPIVQERKLRLREMKQVAQDCMTSK